MTTNKCKKCNRKLIPSNVFKQGFKKCICNEGKYKNEYQKILDITYKDIVQLNPSDCTMKYRNTIHIALCKIINVLRPNPYKEY